MGRKTYKDERRVLEALRHLRTGTVGKLPAREVLVDAFLGTSYNNPELVERFQGVLRSEKKLSLTVLDRCLQKVKEEHERGELFLRDDLLRRSSLLRHNLKTSNTHAPDYRDVNSLISDESVEVKLFSLIHLAVFRTPITQIALLMQKRLSGSLSGLDPVAQVLLLAELEVRETLRLKQQSNREAYAKASIPIDELTSINDIELLLATKLWTRQQEFSLPWDYLSELAESNNYTPLIRYMEPLNQPEWEPVLNWYSLALYSSQSSLEANRKNLKLELRLGVDLPIRWETILQLADKYWAEKEN